MARTNRTASILNTLACRSYQAAVITLFTLRPLTTWPQIEASSHRSRILFYSSNINIQNPTELADPREGPLRRDLYDAMRALLPVMEQA